MTEPATESVYESVPLPLGKNVSIRVITIRPSDGSDRISCDFHVLDLDTKNPIPYIALSYTWGDPPSTEIINLNGKPFLVRKNLWDFLTQARSNCLEEYLWIDALCIDQSVNEERSHQVSIMGRIYSSASRVIVWLGLYSGLAAEGLLFVHAAYLSEHLDFDTMQEYENQLEELFKLPYWTRIWIVQEFVLATSTEIWLGYLKRDGEMFDWLVRSLVDKPTVIPPETSGARTVLQPKASPWHGDHHSARKRARILPIPRLRGQYLIQRAAIRDDYLRIRPQHAVC
jgi:hypothetical protein